MLKEQEKHLRESSDQIKLTQPLCRNGVVIQGRSHFHRQDTKPQGRCQGELRACRDLLGILTVLSTLLQPGANPAPIHFPAHPSTFLVMFTLFLSNSITHLDCSKASVNFNFINHTLCSEQENEGPIKLRDLIVT